jgi:ATP-dependent DNA helicase RecG
MRQNGSPQPGFDFDDDRTYCRLTLPAHPEYVALAALRDYSYRRATGDDEGALRLLETAWTSGQRTPAIAFTLVRDHVERGDLVAARKVVDDLPVSDRSRHARVLTAYASGLLDAGQPEDAKQVLNKLPALLAAQDAFEAAIAERRADRQERAHRYFQSAGEMVLADVRALHEFAQTKLRLAAERQNSQRPADVEVRKRLLSEAAEFLERVLQMDAPPKRHAWAYFDLGRVLGWLGRPRADVVRALEQAIQLLPGETRFQRELERVSRANR